MAEKLIIYQCFPRLLTNSCATPVHDGTLAQNGCGKFNEITPRVLKSIKELGVNCIWYTGVIEHATKTAFPGIPADHPKVVKGEAGSPYAIKDYYDVAPSLAEDVDNRMQEFEALIKRTHSAEMKVLIDFVPNHTARRYHSDVAPKGIEDFGASDDTTRFFSPSNNYYYATNQQFSPHFDIGDYREFPAKATGNDAFHAFPGEYDWYETAKLNYGVDYGDGSCHFDP
ncbi:MAG: alpha-amylase, partial [Muribaculaceae bacterium]|nr:alpha-amylase [Muribaculaceae bacterium]